MQIGIHIRMNGQCDRLPYARHCELICADFGDVTDVADVHLHSGCLVVSDCLQFASENLAAIRPEDGKRPTATAYTKAFSILWTIAQLVYMYCCLHSRLHIAHSP